MKILVTAICAAIFLENACGISISPDDRVRIGPIVDPGPMCTMDLKICTEEQYLGTGPDGCPKCLPCPLRKIGCVDGSTPIKKPRVKNQCPAYYCPNAPVRCTKEMKYCVDGQYLGTGTSGCQECLPCGPIALPSCPVGSKPRINPAVMNQCPSYSCTPRCIGGKCLKQIEEAVAY